MFSIYRKGSREDTYKQKMIIIIAIKVPDIKGLRKQKGEIISAWKGQEKLQKKVTHFF